MLSHCAVCQGPTNLEPKTDSVCQNSQGSTASTSPYSVVGDSTGPVAPAARPREDPSMLLERRCPFLKDGLILSESELQNIDQSRSSVRDEEKEHHIMDDYERQEVAEKPSAVLGKGSNGKVLLVRHKTTRRLFAMKVISLAPTSAAANSDPKCREHVLRNVEREIDFHRKLLHENVVRLYEYSREGSEVYILLEYVKKGTLFQHIERKGRLTENEAFFIFTQVCAALHFLHSNGMIHRDIKPENMLVGENDVVKICDFGCCTHFDSESTKRHAFLPLHYK